MSPTGAALAYGFIDGGAAGGTLLENGVGNRGNPTASPSQGADAPGSSGAKSAAGAAADAISEAGPAKSASGDLNAAGNAARGEVGGGAQSSLGYAGLKLDLETTEAANDVVDSLRATGQLPSNYVTKEGAAQQGWQPGKALNNSVPGGQIGGDVFNNTTNVVPSASGRTWYEADIGLVGTMSRNNQAGARLLYSSDGLLCITNDHYKTATSIGTWK